MNDQDWEVHFKAFRRDLIKLLLEGPLERVENLEVIITDALVRSGMPGVFRLVRDQSKLIDNQRAMIKHSAGKSEPEPGSHCATCGEKRLGLLVVPETSCQACFLASFEKYAGNLGTNKK